MMSNGLTTYIDFNKNHTYRLRPIVIDGQNVAVAHGKEIARGFDSKLRFSARGIQIVVKYFVDRGHKKQEVIVWLPEILKDKLDKVIIVTSVWYHYFFIYYSLTFNFSTFRSLKIFVITKPLLTSWKKMDTSNILKSGHSPVEKFESAMTTGNMLEKYLPRNVADLVG